MTAQERRLKDILSSVFDKEGEEGVLFSVHHSRNDGYETGGGTVFPSPEAEALDFNVECLYRHAEGDLLPDTVREVFSEHVFTSRFGSYEQVNVWRFPGGVLKGHLRCPEDGGSDESDAPLFAGKAWMSDREDILDAIEKALKDQALDDVIRPTMKRLSRCAEKDPEGVLRAIAAIRKDEPIPVAVVIPAVHQEQGRNHWVHHHELSLANVRKDVRLASTDDIRGPRDWHVVSVTTYRDMKDVKVRPQISDSYRFPVLDVLCSCKTQEEAQRERWETYGDDDPEARNRRAMESYSEKMVRGVVLSTEEVRMLPHNFSHYGLDADFTADSLRHKIAAPAPDEDETPGPGH